VCVCGLVALLCVACRCNEINVNVKQVTAILFECKLHILFVQRVAIDLFFAQQTPVKNFRTKRGLEFETMKRVDESQLLEQTVNKETEDIENILKKSMQGMWYLSDLCFI
jgi:hypothetical protein